MKRKLYILAAAVVIAIAITTLIACGTGKVTIEFVTGTDEVIPTQVRSLDEAYGELPTPTRKYYKFCGWTTQPDGEETVGASTKPSGGSKYTLYARWEFVGAGRVRSTIASSGISNYVIDDNGELWAWGDNSFGQLGIGSLVNTYEPVKVKTDRKFVEVSSSSYACYAIDTENKLWAWGRNDGGQLGNGTTAQSTVPTEVIKIKGVSKISMKSNHAYALDLDGHIWVWGDFGDINPNTFAKLVHPIPTLVQSDAEFIDIDAGGDHVLALDKDGYIWSFGKNDRGQLGNGTTVTERVEFKTQYTPKMIDADIRFSQIGAGLIHSLAVDIDGNLWAWGSAVNGQLGDVSADIQKKPIKINIDIPIVKVYAEGSSSYVIDEENGLWCFGLNMNKRYFGEENDRITEPIKVMEGIKLEELAGFDSFIAKDTDGNIIGWGNNNDGLIADGNYKKQFIPQNIMENKSFSQIASGDNHSLALDNDGRIWAWGKNSNGQLGDGTEELKRTPIQIMPDMEFKCIAACGNSSYAVDLDGNIWSWGYNSRGQLGDGTYLNKNTPQKLQTSVKFDKVFAGDGCAFALDTSGKAYAWGNNVGGSLNGKSSANRFLAPTPILTDKSFMQIEYNNNGIYALDLNRVLYNYKYGKVTEIAEEVDKFALGSSDVLNLDKSGNLWGFGSNMNGTLRGQNREKVDKFNLVEHPQIIDDGILYKSISIKFTCAFAVTETGKLVGWGSRSCGASISQLGIDFDFAYLYDMSFFSVVEFENSVGYSDVVLGSFHGVALDNDGHIRTWGRNNSGQLGNGIDPALYSVSKITLA